MIGKMSAAMRALLLLLIKAHQTLLSPALGASCRFTPTCSSYAEQVVRRHGAGRGGVLALRRILRCHPWHPGGWDPPPP